MTIKKIASLIGAIACFTVMNAVYANVLIATMPGKKFDTIIGEKNFSQNRVAQLTREHSISTDHQKVLDINTNKKFDQYSGKVVLVSGASGCRAGDHIFDVFVDYQLSDSNIKVPRTVLCANSSEISNTIAQSFSRRIHKPIIQTHMMRHHILNKTQAQTFNSLLKK